MYPKGNKPFGVIPKFVTLHRPTPASLWSITLSAGKLLVNVVQTLVAGSNVCSMSGTAWQRNKKCFSSIHVRFKPTSLIDEQGSFSVRSRLDAHEKLRLLRLMVLLPDRAFCLESLRDVDSVSSLFAESAGAESGQIQVVMLEIMPSAHARSTPSGHLPVIGSVHEPS